MTKSKMSWPLVGLLILAVGMSLAAQLAERRGLNGLTGGVASSPSGAPEKGKADGPRE